MTDGSDYLVSLAQLADTQTGPLAYLFRGVNNDELTAELVTASRVIEGMVTGRLLPFSTSEDIRTNVYDGVNRVGWVAERPAYRPELWSGVVTSLTLFGYDNSVVSVDVTTVDFDVRLGCVRFPDPTACTSPWTSWGLGYGGEQRARVVYTGGFAPGAVPEELTQATLLEAAAARRREVNSEDSRDAAVNLESQVDMLVRPWQAAVSVVIG